MDPNAGRAKPKYATSPLYLGWNTWHVQKMSARWREHHDGTIDPSGGFGDPANYDRRYGREWYGAVNTSKPVRSTKAQQKHEETFHIADGHACGLCFIVIPSRMCSCVLAKTSPFGEKQLCLWQRKYPKRNSNREFEMVSK